MLHGSDIGKIEIYDDCSVVAVPSDSIENVLDRMYGAKVCGKPVRVSLYEEPKRNHRNKPENHKKSDNASNRTKEYGKHKNDRKKINAKKAYRHAAKRHR